MKNANRRWETPHYNKQQNSLLPKNTIENNHTNMKITSKIKGSNNHYSLLSLNINGVNWPIKRHRIIDRICKQDPVFSAYMKCTSDTKTGTTSEKKFGK